MASKVGISRPASVVKPKRRKTGGRKAGTPNKATATAKEAIALLADGMTGELQDWLRASAYGVGRAWLQWDPEPDAEGVLPERPEGARKSGRVWEIPVLDEKGEPMVVGLPDVMSGRVPPEAKIEWITRPAPGATTDTMLRALEYHIPKLSRTEVTGKDGKDIIPATIQVVGVAAPKRD